MPEIPHIPSPESKPTIIRQLHLLIHPGFCTDPDDPVDEIVLSDAERFVQKYIDQAQKLQLDEAMIVLTHNVGDQFIQDVKARKKYIEILKRIKAILVDRAIVLCGPNDLFDPDGITFPKALALLQSRGFALDDHTQYVAYGESLGCCVTETATNFYSAMGLSSPINIISELTDVGLVQKPKIIEGVRNRNSPCYCVDDLIFGE